MRMLPNYAVFIVLMAVLFSCRKERSFENLNGTPVTDRQWQFKESGAMFSGTMDSAFNRAFGVANSLNLSGTATDGKGRISLQIISSGSIIKGDYKNPQVSFQYSQGGAIIFQNSSDQGNDFTITITSIDSNSVTGTFSGIALDTLGSKQTISEGKFTAVIATVAPALFERGQLTVWSKQLCGGNGNISIKVGDSSGAITQAIATQPSCGAAGTATFNLPAGAYSVIAVCGTDTLVYNASVLPKVCTTLEVDFSQLLKMDYFPLVSAWTYGNVSDSNNDTLAINSIGDTIINGEPFTRFLNARTNVTNYYRKKPGIYYQYLFSAFSQALTSPVQVIILQENFPLNTAWESDPFLVDFGSTGIPLTLTVKLKSKITKANYSATINGQSYNHLIEVTSELFSKNADGSYSDTQTGYKMVFGKGIGIVFYQDLNTGLDWGIRHYNVSF